jgi:triphosphatase
METELKFKLTAAKRKAIERILTARGLTPSKTAERYETTYFDSPDFAVADAGLSLRIRRVGKGFTQTLKAIEATGDTPAQRFETEWHIKKAELDTSLLIATPLSRTRALDHRLSPLFVTDIERTTYRIPLGPGAYAELTIDQGAIRAGKARQTVHELEIELKRGSPSALYHFAVGLHAEQALEVMTESKAARGYRLIGARQPRAHENVPPRLRKTVTVGAAIRTILGSGLGQLLVNLPALAADIEGLHQARVAIRRLRSALMLFEDHVEPQAASGFQAKLKRFGQTLGDARDWDVFVRETIPRARYDGQVQSDGKTAGNGLDHQWIDLLAAKAEAARQRAHGAVERMTASADFTGFVLTLGGWIEGAAWLNQDGNGGIPLRDAAPGMFDQLERKVLKRGRCIAHSNAEELHALRKTLKKLRYSLDYLPGLYPARRVEKFLNACKKLQKVLGEINDMATTDRLVALLSQNGDIAVAPGAGLLDEWTLRRREAALAKLPKVWEKFEDARRFWAVD